MNIYSMTESNDRETFLGMALEKRPDGAVVIHQRPYIEALAQRFNLSDTKGVSTPMDPGSNLTKYTGQATEEEIHEYLVGIGSLNWVVGISRPDIAFATNRLARFAANPGPMHFKAMYHLIRYLEKTKEIGLVFGPIVASPENWPIKLLVYSDASLITDTENKRSTTGGIIFVEGILVSWTSRLQTVLAHSTLDAEFIALSTNATNSVIMARFIEDTFATMGDPNKIAVELPIPMLCDSAAAVINSKPMSTTTKMRHLELKEKICRTYVEHGQAMVMQIPTKENAADGFTKPLPVPGIERMRKALNLE